MCKIGDFLRQQRQKLGLSMSEVHKRTGITDSKLSRIERNEGRSLDPLELKKLADLYHVNIVTLYHIAGYLSANDLRDYRFVFDGANLLTEEEQKIIQTLISLFIKERVIKSNDL
jgi:DNA-binding helix-turn-helix protein